MELAYITTTILFWMSAILVSVLYYRYLLAILGLIFYFPLIAYLQVLSGICNLLGFYNRRMLEQGRITIWLKRLTSLSRYVIEKSEELLEDYFNFVFGGKVSMAIVVQKPGENIRYVPKAERELPVGEQTAFYMEKQKRSKLAAERDRLVGLSEKGRVDSLRSATVNYRITVLQLAGWENVLDVHGNPVPFDEKNKEAMYELLPPSIQEELEEEFGSGGVRTKEETDSE
jgi:hypothetical protein